MYWIRSCPATGRRECDGTFVDAAFAKPDIYEYLEERRVFYAIRLPSNKVLQYEIAPLLIRPVGRRAEASSDPIRRLLVSCRELGTALGVW